MIELIGWCSAILFIICGIPQAIQSIKEGHSNGISSAFLIMWYAGAISGVVYIYLETIVLWPVLIDYLFNIMIVTIIMKYKYFPRKGKESI